MMTEPMDESATTTGVTTGLPTAAVVKRSGWTESKFWILTGASLLVAIALAWWSMPKPGTEISIHFPAGHGLGVGDAVRYRGIDVGEVRSIRLQPELDGVEVKVAMDPSAKRLLQGGTAKFWIVRPTLGMSGVSGLETAVGPKYIAVSPPRLNEENSAPRFEYQGLASAPAGGSDQDGVEIVLRGDKRYSVSPGAAVMYRGVEVGRILEVGLSQDARFVDLRATIFDPHHKLVTSETQFWANSGVDFDFSLRNGLSLDSESLETIARGGVSFLTLKRGGKEIAPGQIFKLNPNSDDAWQAQADTVRLPTVELKGAVTLVIEEARGGLLGFRKRTRLVSAIPVQAGSAGTGLVVPGSIVAGFAGESPQFGSVSIDGIDDSELSQTLLDRLVQLANSEAELQHRSPVVFLPITPNTKLPWQSLSSQEFSIENCVAVRRPVAATGNLFLQHIVESTAMRWATDDTIEVIDFEGDRDLWNGSPLLSLNHGEIVGMLVVDQSKATVVPASMIMTAIDGTQ